MEKREANESACAYLREQWFVHKRGREVEKEERKKQEEEGEEGKYVHAVPHKKISQIYNDE